MTSVPFSREHIRLIKNHFQSYHTILLQYLCYTCKCPHPNTYTCMYYTAYSEYQIPGDDTPLVHPLLTKSHH